MTIRRRAPIAASRGSVASNLVRMCSRHHDYKTQHGREVRSLLIAYLDDVMQRAETIG